MAYDLDDNSNFIKEIGIFEIRRHIPILYSFMNICKTEKTNVTIFTTKKLYSRLNTYLDDNKKKSYNFVIKNEKESDSSYLKRVEKICNKKMDVLIINTIHESFFDLISYCNFNPKIKTILVMHHVNAWLNPKFVFNIYHPLRTLNTYLSTFLITNFIFKKFDAINVIYHPLKNYIEENTDYSKKIFTLPTSIFEESKINLNKENKNSISITIPGLIQKHRKKYQPTIDAFKNIFKKYDKKISVSVLGIPIGRYGRKIYDQFIKLKKQGYNVEISDNFVPDTDFEKIMNKSDIILAPIRIKTKSDGEIKEYYGKTVGSGVVFDAIKYAKPIIVPFKFNMLPELESSTMRYKDLKDLENIISELLTNNDKLKTLKKEALNNSRKFSLEKLQRYFQKEILTWIEK